MISEIIIIGTEVVRGQILDTNSKYLAGILTGIGYEINFITTVDDNYNRIYNSIAKAYDRADVIIITGGLGPTSDDITREVVSDFFGLKLVLKKNLKKNNQSILHKEKYFDAAYKY